MSVEIDGASFKPANIKPQFILSSRTIKSEPKYILYLYIMEVEENNNIVYFIF